MKMGRALDMRDHALRLLVTGILPSCFVLIEEIRGEDSLIGHEDIFHSFAESFDIEKDWGMFLDKEEPLDLVQALLKKDATGRHVVTRGEATVTSTWVATDLWLKKNPNVLSALRLAQDAKDPKLPVTGLTGGGCLGFVNKLNERHGGKRGDYPGAFNLPTEAQWEYRGGPTALGRLTFP